MKTAPLTDVSIYTKAKARWQTLLNKIHVWILGLVEISILVTSVMGSVYLALGSTGSTYVFIVSLMLGGISLIYLKKY